MHIRKYIDISMVSINILDFLKFCLGSYIVLTYSKIKTIFGHFFFKATCVAVVVKKLRMIFFISRAYVVSMFDCLPWQAINLRCFS